MKSFRLLVLSLLLIAALMLLAYVSLPALLERVAANWLGGRGFETVNFEAGLPGLSGFKIQNLKFTFKTGANRLAGTVGALSLSYDLFGGNKNVVSSVLVSDGTLTLSTVKESKNEKVEQISGRAIKEFILNLGIESLKLEKVTLNLDTLGELKVDKLQIESGRQALFEGRYQIKDYALGGTISFDARNGAVVADTLVSQDLVKLIALKLEAELGAGSEIILKSQSSAELFGFADQVIELRLLKDSSCDWQESLCKPAEIALQIPKLKLESAIAKIPAHSFRDSGWQASFELKRVDLQELLKLYSRESLKISGVLDTQFTLDYSPLGFSVSDGKLSSVSPGGIIQYDSSNLAAASQPGLELAFQTLRNFVYKEIVGKVNLRPDGKLLLDLTIGGNNPDWQGGRALNLNLTLEENIFELLRTVRLTTQLEGELKSVLKEAK